MNSDNNGSPPVVHTAEEERVGDTAIEYTVEQIFERHGQEMIRRAKSVLRSDADADDVVQDVMLTIVRAPHLLDVVERLGAWLLSLVHRRCIDVLRGGARRDAKEAETPGGIRDVLPGRDPADIAESDETCRAIAQAIDRLDDELRTVFVANVLEEKTYREISRETRIPMGTLMARKARALATVRDDLARRGLVEPGRSKGDA